MSDPQVSVLLPVYNAESTLPKCIQSIRRQSMTDWECILVDDGSVDASLEIAEDAARKDSRFHVLATQHDGIVQAPYKGIPYCRAPFIARMDADDSMHPQRLEAQSRALNAEPEWSAVGSHVRIFPRSGLKDGMLAYESWLNSICSPQQVRRECYVECCVANPTLMYRASVLRRFPVRDCGWPEDYDLLLRMLHRGAQVGVLARRLHAWRDDARRPTRTDVRYSQARFVACKAHYLAHHFLRAETHYVLCGYGDTGRALRRALRQEGKEASHILEVNPRLIGQRVEGADILAHTHLPQLREYKVIASVAGLQRRHALRQFLRQWKMLELKDFVCAA